VEEVVVAAAVLSVVQEAAWDRVAVEAMEVAAVGTEVAVHEEEVWGRINADSDMRGRGSCCMAVVSRAAAAVDPSARVGGLR